MKTALDFAQELHEATQTVIEKAAQEGIDHSAFMNALPDYFHNRLILAQQLAMRKLRIESARPAPTPFTPREPVRFNGRRGVETR